MTRWQLERRIRARLHGERGFTLVETVIAIVMIFGSLTALAYTATIGFGYGNLAKQKQVATGIANQLMEEIRGLAYDTVAKGLLTSDVPGGDANIVACGTVYRYLSCTDTSTPGATEKIVNSTSAANPTVPLVPHQGTIAKNGVTFSWSTYVTNDCAVVDAANGCPAVNPYRVTVLVTWTGGAAAPNKLVSVQSLLYSPGGCRSTATHPFAAPCQPFFFGEATVPQGQITITSVSPAGLPNTTFVSGDLLTASLEANAQQEQLSQVQASYTPVGVQLTDDVGTQTAGASSATSTAADSDPGSTSVSTYATNTLTSPVSSTTIVTPSSGNTHIDFTTPAGGTATASSTTSAGGSNVCPPPTDTAETDLKPCSGARQQQGGTLSAAFTANNLSQPLGTTTLAQVGVAANLPNKVFENRVVNGTTGAMCSPAANMDGCLEQTAIRRFGTIGIGGLPSSITAPVGWNGFFLLINGYQDQCVAAVGNQSTTTVVPAPTATVTAGTISYWNGVGYTTVPVTDSSLNSLATNSVAGTFVSGNGGHVTQVVMATVPTGMSAATTSITPSVGALSLTSAQALVSPPQVAVSFTVSIDATTVVQLQVTVNLKQLEARGVYGAAPGQGT
jgi:type II secretory pathway pseudopilin PulG